MYVCEQLCRLVCVLDKFEMHKKLRGGGGGGGGSWNLRLPCYFRIEPKPWGTTQTSRYKMYNYNSRISSYAGPNSRLAVVI